MTTLENDIDTAQIPDESTEDEARKAHEESEAKRKAEWESAKKAREDAENLAWEKALAMSADKLLEASVKRLADDAERITRRNLKQAITEYVQMQCYDDEAFARQVLHPRKSMIQCFRYVNRKAFEFVKQEMKDNGIEPSREGYGCDVPDDLCYQWAVDYFSDMNAPEDKRTDEIEFVPKPYRATTPKKSVKAKPENKSESVKKPTPEPETAQLSFFDTEVE